MQPGTGEPFFSGPAATSVSGVTLLLNQPVESINSLEKAITITGGNSVNFEKLLLATGTTPRRLSVPGSDNPDICYLRNLEDAKFIRNRLRDGASLVVVGGGFIGLEVAAAARKTGTNVTVLEGLSRLMARAVPADIADKIAERHHDEGVEFLFDETVESFGRRQSRVVITTKTGRTLEADLVVVGVGVEPATAIADSADLKVHDGIWVDAFCRTSDPDILAAGDCANFPLHMADGARVRLQSWRHAHDQGAVAAFNMIGEATPYQGVPWFWSDQYDLGLQVTGLLPAPVDLVRRNLPGDALLLFHLDESGRLMGASGVGTGNAISRDIKLAEKLIERCASPAPEALADPSISLKKLLRAG